jgi:hypothetical protein
VLGLARHALQRKNPCAKAGKDHSRRSRHAKLEWPTVLARSLALALSEAPRYSDMV